MSSFLHSSQDEIERAYAIAGGMSDRETFREAQLSEPSNKNKLAETILRILPNSFSTLLWYSGLTSVEQASLVVRLFGVTIAGLILAALHPGFLILPLCYIFAEYALLAKKTSSRALEFEKDYPALLLSLASSVKAGRDPIEAISESAELFQKDSVMEKELQAFLKITETGMSAEESIRKFAERIDLKDISLFKTVLILNLKEGASIAECLQRLTKVTRSRQSFRRKIRSSLAVQRLSSVGITVSFGAIAVMQVIGNSDALTHAFKHQTGFKILMAGAILMIIGAVWMKMMVNSKVD